MEKRVIMNCKEIVSSLKKHMPERTMDNAIMVANKLVTSLEIEGYPVPIVSTLTELGFSIFVDRIPRGLSGFLIVDASLLGKFKTDKIIAVDRGDSVGRQRFTIAHEFAHYLFDFNEDTEKKFVSTYDNSKADTDYERIPSRFAAEFLMPTKMFMKRFAALSYMTKYERVVQLVRDFSVTDTAVRRRIQELGLDTNGN